LGGILASIHNLAFYLGILKRVRTGLEATPAIEAREVRQ